jgi:hypothetical protein
VAVEVAGITGQAVILLVLAALAAGLQAAQMRLEMPLRQIQAAVVAVVAVVCLLLAGLAALVLSSSATQVASAARAAR